MKYFEIRNIESHETYRQMIDVETQKNQSSATTSRRRRQQHYIIQCINNDNAYDSSQYNYH
jgi:hypothetical protein